MSRENVELVLRAYDAFNRRDWDAFVALMDDNVPDYDIEVVDVRDLGDVTLASLRALGHGAGSDVPFEDLLWHTGRWRRGKCVWWAAFPSEAEALEAVGPRE
jgi:hypothetical protein